MERMNPVHLKFATLLMTIIGTWPLKLSGLSMKFYNAYFYITFTYYIIYDCTMAAMVFISKGSFVETASNLNVTIVYFVNIYKILICRSSTIKTIIEEIDSREECIMKSKNENIKDIFKKHVRSAFVSMIFYVSLGSCGISLYFITPVVKNLLAKGSNNPENHKYLIFSSWFPFDSDSHYAIAYLIQFLGGFFGYAYIVYPGAFFFAILKFIIGQIKILQHIFKNLSDNISRYSKENNLGMEESQMLFTKLCIKEHQYLISLVERFNNSIKTFMLLEFIISSFQLSLVVYQILQSNGGLIEQVAVLSYLVTLCAQLFLFYWNAHDIIVQSMGISGAIFESEWSTLDLNVQKMLMLVIQRSQKPLGISIGPIYQVRLESLIAIFKAIYSYVAVIQK